MVLIFAILLFLFCVNVSAQVIKGRVTDSTTNEALSYAAVEIRSFEDDVYIGGSSTNEKGEFEFHLKGRYPKIRITVSFLGYKTIQKVYAPATEYSYLKFEMQEDSQTLNEVVVKGLSPAEKVQRLAYNVSLVETAKLKSTTMDLSNVIDKISGVKIRSTGGVGSEANVTLNGFSGRHVKIFIDGVPMDGMSSAFGLNNIPVGLAKRVEVYKGVVPIELGGDALGGAINIVTDNSRCTRVNASYSFGSFNTHKTNVYAEHTTKKGFYVSLNAYQNYSDNDYKVNIDSYTKFNEDGSNQEVKENLTVRRFHAKYHNEVAILKIGIVDKTFADRLLLGFMGGYEYKQTQNASTMDWVYGARYTTANTLMPQLTYEKRFKVLKGLHVSLNGNYSISGGIRELEEHGYLIRERVRGANGQLGSIEYTILEQPKEPTPAQEKPIRENPVQANPTLVTPVQEEPAQLNKEESSNYPSRTDLSSTELSNPIQSNPPTPAGARMGTDRMGARECYREVILDNIEYSYLVQDSHIDREQLDEIVDLIVDTVCSARKVIRIAGDDYPAEVVKSRFMKLDSSHVQYVMDCMKDNTTYVRNIKKYLLAALYNAPTTINSYYSSLVQHDMYGDGQRGRG